tara:strand:+ start:117 stop:404 length:288 start_codon:yes stop_codon:yes gene_type:complete
MQLPKEILDRVTWTEAPKGQEASLPSIKSIAPIVSECELGCGKIVDQQQGHTLAKRVTPIEYWQSQCKVCKQYKNPKTGAYDCTLVELNVILRQK